MVDISQKDLDQMISDFEEMKFKAGAWWPTMDDVKKKIEPNIREKLKFVIWITETADEPETEEEKAVKKRLLHIIYNNVKVTEEN